MEVLTPLLMAAGHELVLFFLLFKNVQNAKDCSEFAFQGPHYNYQSNARLYETFGKQFFTEKNGQRTRYLLDGTGV